MSKSWKIEKNGLNRAILVKAWHKNDQSQRRKRDSKIGKKSEKNVKKF